MNGTPKYDSEAATLLHIKRVAQLLTEAASELIKRANVHDESKLHSPEKEFFDEFTPKLAASTYGSEEYKGFLEQLKVGLDHHYANNSHHPEHSKLWYCPNCKKNVQEKGTWFSEITRTRFCMGCSGGAAIYECSLTDEDLVISLDGMDLFDLLEMLLDWKAATERHKDGDINKSLVHNKDRFRISPQVVNILQNTIDRYLTKK